MTESIPRLGLRSGAGHLGNGRDAHLLPIQDRPDDGVAHGMTVDQEEDAVGEGTYHEELEEAGKGPSHHDDLQAEDEGEVSEVDPVGGVGEVADALV